MYIREQHPSAASCATPLIGVTAVVLSGRAARGGPGGLGSLLLLAAVSPALLLGSLRLDSLTALMDEVAESFVALGPRAHRTLPLPPLPLAEATLVRSRRGEVLVGRRRGPSAGDSSIVIAAAAVVRHARCCCCCCPFLAGDVSCYGWVLQACFNSLGTIFCFSPAEGRLSIPLHIPNVWQQAHSPQNGRQDIKCTTAGEFSLDSRLESGRERVQT